MNNVFRMLCLVAVLLGAGSVSAAQEREEYYRVPAVGGPLASVQADKRVNVNQLYSVRDIHGCALEPEDADNYPYAEYLIPISARSSGSKTRRWLAAANAEWQRKVEQQRTLVARRAARVRTVPSPTPTVGVSPTPQVRTTPIPAATPYLPAAGSAVSSTRATAVYFALHPTLHMRVGDRRNVYYVVGYGSTVRAEPVSVSAYALRVSEAGSPAATATTPAVTPSGSGSPLSGLPVTTGVAEPGVAWIEAVRPGSAEVRFETRDRAILASIPVLVESSDASLSSLSNTILLWVLGGVCLSALVWGLRTYWVRYRHQP